MGRKDGIVEQLQPLLDPGESISHAFVANFGTSKPSQAAMLVVAVTDRNIVTASVRHMFRWKVSTDKVHRLPREPFAELPEVGRAGFERWHWNGLDLWLDKKGRKEAGEANQILGGP